jgi:hypothetical protein
LDAALPGSEGSESADEIVVRLQNIHPNIPPETLAGLVSRHGTRAENLLANISLVSEMPANTGTDTATDIPSPLGRDFGGGLTEYEARYFIAHEWATNRRRHSLASYQGGAVHERRPTAGIRRLAGAGHGGGSGAAIRAAIRAGGQWTGSNPGTRPEISPR